MESEDILYEQGRSLLKHRRPSKVATFSLLVATALDAVINIVASSFSFPSLEITLLCLK